MKTMEKRNRNTIDMEVGRKVKHLRKTVGVTQSQLAQELGVSFQQVQKYENGTNRIAAGTLYQIAEILGVNVSAFFPVREPKPIKNSISPSYLGVLWSLHASQNSKVREKISQLLVELNKETL
jgi:transcriptional regulator with XRE-family HTH domain